MRSVPARQARLALVTLVVVWLAAAAGDGVHAQGYVEFTVRARKFAFEVLGQDKPEMYVKLGDVVKITFEAMDIPHSFTTADDPPHYRIDRRAEPGKPVTFEVHADQVGRIPIRCTLTIDPRCRDMLAWLIVTKD